MTDQEMIAQLKQQIRDYIRKIHNLTRQVKHAMQTKAQIKADAKTAKAEAAKTQHERRLSRRKDMPFYAEIQKKHVKFSFSAEKLLTN